MSKLSFLQIDVEPGELLFKDDFTEEVTKNWEVSKDDWVSKDGILTGISRDNLGALVYSKQQYPGDIMLDFYGKMLSPCNNDLNFTFRADGWDYEHNDASVGYIGGLNGWWTLQAGLEKYPGCDLRALSGFKAEADREYHLQTGIVDATLFLAVDGEVVVTLSDPDPIVAENCNRVGLGVYCSKVEFRDFKVYRPKVTPVERYYVAKF